MESKKSLTIQEKSQTLLKPSTAIVKLDKVFVLGEISTLIQGAAKLYQIPNFDEVNALILSEWVFDEYQHRDLGLVQEALKRPPVIRNAEGQVAQVWRLTPDILKQWIDQRSLEREEERQRKESLRRQEELKMPELKPETEKEIQDHVDHLRGLWMKEVEERRRPRAVPVLTDQQIKEEGDTRPKAIFHPTISIEEKRKHTERIRGFMEIAYREKHPGCEDKEVERFLNKHAPFEKILTKQK